MLIISLLLRLDRLPGPLNHLRRLVGAWYAIDGLVLNPSERLGEEGKLCNSGNKKKSFRCASQSELGNNVDGSNFQQLSNFFLSSLYSILAWPFDIPVERLIITRALYGSILN